MKAQCRLFYSLKDADYSWLGLVIDQVVNLVVAMDQCSPVLRLRIRISKKGYCIIVMRDLSHRTFRFNVNDLGLRRRNGTKGLDLTVVEA